MSRPGGEQLLVKDQFAVIKIESLWGITYQGEFIQVTEDILVSFRTQKKYPKSVYRSRANAVMHSDKLNKMFNTTEFSVQCLYQRTAKKEE